MPGVLSLANIAMLVDEGGQITVGALRPIPCVAVANNEHDTVAMLRRRPEESVLQLLERLDQAIATVAATGRRIDEINPAPPSRKR